MSAKLLPIFDTQYISESQTSFYVGNMLFIKLNNKDNNSFLILYIDFKKRLKDQSDVYYLGDIRGWNGYFYDPQRKMKIMLLS